MWVEWSTTSASTFAHTVAGGKAGDREKKVPAGSV